jgi:beta-ureidopropionase
MVKKTKHITRRGLLQSTSVGLGLGLWANCRSSASAALTPDRPKPRKKRLPREVWIGTITQNSIKARDYKDMVRKMLMRLKEIASFEPDIICLPEVFALENLSKAGPPISRVAEVPLGEITGPFAEFARKHRCYMVCPTYTKQDGRYYNSAVFIDRQGRAMGEYHKMHPTIGEMNKGITPGSLEPPVFQTDFGLVGTQICFDIKWNDGWQKLRRDGAEIVFWPSAFAGGKAVNTKAWQNKYVVVSSTNKDTAKVCDISGEVIAATGRWSDWICAPVNLEKAFLHTWPFCRRFNDVQAKYGRKILIKTLYEEEWTIIESRSQDVKIADVLKEFDFQTYEDFIEAADRLQKKNRV